MCSKSCLFNLPPIPYSKPNYIIKKILKKKALIRVTASLQPQNQHPTPLSPVLPSTRTRPHLRTNRLIPKASNLTLWTLGSKWSLTASRQAGTLTEKF